MSAPALRPLSTGEILDVSFGLYRQRFGPLVKVALLTAALPMLIGIYVTTAGGQFANLGLLVANLILKTVLDIVALGATIFIVSESYLGHDLSAADALKRSAPFLGRLIWLSILLGPGDRYRLPAVLLPGCVFLAGLIASIPALVLENHQSAPRGDGTCLGSLAGFPPEAIRASSATVAHPAGHPCDGGGILSSGLHQSAAGYELDGGGREPRRSLSGSRGFCRS